LVRAIPEVISELMGAAAIACLKNATRCQLIVKSLDVVEFVLFPLRGCPGKAIKETRKKMVSQMQNTYSNTNGFSDALIVSLVSSSATSQVNGVV
jgi:hypothetical protein